MKTKIFAFTLGMLCLLSTAFSQSNTLTGFNGKVQFSSFADQGPNVRGTLSAFVDQTNQYFASDIDTNDIAWDNQGRRYIVVAVISSNLTQAVVDLSRIGGGSHIPTGVGFVNRETSNGLSLLPTTNSTGISSQLQGRVLTHNMKILEGLWPPANIYNSDGVISNTRTISLGLNGDYLKIIGTSNNKAVELYATTSDFLGDIYSYAKATKSGSNHYHQDYKAVGVYKGARPYTYLDILATSYIGSDVISSVIIDASIFNTTDNRNDAKLKLRTDSTATSTSAVLMMRTQNNVNPNYHWAGFNDGSSIEGAQRTITTSPSFIVQTQKSNTSTVFNWIWVNNLDTDTTSNRFSIYNGKIVFPNARPSTTASAISSLIWTAGTPSFIRSQHSTTSGTTDASGDITVTIPAMPDATYEVQLTINGTTYYGLSYHTLTTTTFKIRAFDGTHAAVGAGINLTVAYDLKDY
ncbi:hypothetical protein [Haliscomenobacter hydrossis]|uniref:Uncharacterized protein n=1 Tax=Haliscomenobacter hydrossis (strain ATCC 27775 / DSM 1100 / LMG 10767 / O) TaxID=760192 RepID=F4KZ68_HALH1|nr:hypothetical protein [Haliscomenobacter hydrossis]AEE53722.1 hypothetical protein Halhy_5899 [Haliscomenobacter hydrossis DSM 1100]